MTGNQIIGRLCVHSPPSRFPGSVLGDPFRFLWMQRTNPKPFLFPVVSHGAPSHRSKLQFFQVTTKCQAKNSQSHMFQWLFFFSDLQPQCSVRKHFKKHAVSFLIHSSFHPEKKTIIWCFSLEIFLKKIIFWFTHTHTHTQNTLEIELPYDPAKSHCWVYTLRKPEFLGSISQQGDYSWWYCTLYLKVAKKWSESHSVVSDSLWLHGL